METFTRCTVIQNIVACTSPLLKNRFVTCLIEELRKTLVATIRNNAITQMCSYKVAYVALLPDVHTRNIFYPSTSTLLV